MVSEPNRVYQDSEVEKKFSAVVRIWGIRARGFIYTTGIVTPAFLMASRRAEIYGPVEPNWNESSIERRYQQVNTARRYIELLFPGNCFCSNARGYSNRPIHNNITSTLLLQFYSPL